jgi:hypothetical protein
VGKGVRGRAKLQLSVGRLCPPYGVLELSARAGIEGRLVLGVRRRAFGLLSHHWSGAMSLLISILITFVVIILLLYLVNLLPIDGRAKQIVRVIIIIIGILSLLRYLAVF